MKNRKTILPKESLIILFIIFLAVFVYAQGSGEAPGGEGRGLPGGTTQGATAGSGEGGGSTSTTQQQSQEYGPGTSDVSKYFPDYGKVELNVANQGEEGQKNPNTVTVTPNQEGGASFNWEGRDGMSLSFTQKSESGAGETQTMNFAGVEGGSTVNIRPDEAGNPAISEGTENAVIGKDPKNMFHEEDRGTKVTFEGGVEATLHEGDEINSVAKDAENSNQVNVEITPNSGEVQQPKPAENYDTESDLNEGKTRIHYNLEKSGEEGVTLKDPNGEVISENARGNGLYADDKSFYLSKESKTAEGHEVESLKGLGLKDGRGEDISLFRTESSDAKTRIIGMNDEFDKNDLEKGDALLRIGEGENGEFLRYETNGPAPPDLINFKSIEEGRPKSGPIMNIESAKQEGPTTTSWRQKEDGSYEMKVTNANAQLADISGKSTIETGDSKGIVSQNGDFTMYNMQDSNPGKLNSNENPQQVLTITQELNGKETSRVLDSFGNGQYILRPESATYNPQSRGYVGSDGRAVEPRVIYNTPSSELTRQEQAIQTANRDPTIAQGETPGKAAERISQENINLNAWSGGQALTPNNPDIRNPSLPDKSIVPNPTIPPTVPPTQNQKITSPGFTPTFDYSIIPANQNSQDTFAETDNFRVRAPEGGAAQYARQLEGYRNDLAKAWFGRPLGANANNPNGFDWREKAEVNIRTGSRLGAGGATSFVFDRGDVFGWKMDIQGSRERLLDSVIPHEVTHMVYATQFKQPVPRWLDEGGASSVEANSETTKHYRMLTQFLQSGRGIAFNDMMNMKEYPRDIMPLYAQGFGVSQYLIELQGRQKFMQFAREGMSNNDWNSALRKNYGFANTGDFQAKWTDYIAKKLRERGHY